MGDLEQKLILGTWNNYKDGWEVRQRAVSVDKEGFEQVEIQERLQPVLSPRLCLSVSTPTLSESSCSPYFRNKKNLHIVKACLQQTKASSAMVKEIVDRDLGYTGQEIPSHPNLPILPSQKFPVQNSFIWSH